MVFCCVGRRAHALSNTLNGEHNAQGVYFSKAGKSYAKVHHTQPVLISTGADGPWCRH
jgi:hypothetical protein